MAVRREDRDGSVVSGRHGRRFLDGKITGIWSFGFDDVDFCCMSCRSCGEVALLPVLTRRLLESGSAVGAKF